MPLDPVVEAAKRKAMAKVFEKTQREMASAVDELAITRRLPVPYESNEPVPEVTLPYPQDHHLIRSIELVPKRQLPFFVAADSLQNPCSGGKPWASFNPSVPSVLAGREPTKAAPPVAKPTTDEEMWRTRHNEWTLQKNAYNPDIASQMRTNVRKAAALTSAVNVEDAFSVQKALIASSINVSTALSYSDVTGPAPKIERKPLVLNDVWPQGRVR